jgi:hypothetical protein
LDGNLIFNVAWSWFGWDGGNQPTNQPYNGEANAFFGSNNSLGGEPGPCGAPVGHFYPPGGLVFHHSLVVTMQPAPWWNQPNTGVWFWGMGTFTAQGYYQ